MNMLIREKIYIILINYNSIEHTCECVESIFNSEGNFDLFTVIIDNASQENVNKKIIDSFMDREYYSKIFLIKNKENLGFGAANNIGIDFAIHHDADYILILNNDTVIDKNCIRYLKMTVDSNDDMILSTGKILNYYQKKLIWYAGGDLSDYKGDAVSYGFNTIDDGQFDKVLSCTFASGCCMFGKSKLFQNIIFSEDYFLYFEDVGFCKELYKFGYKIIYNPKAIIYHKESASTKKNSKLYVYYFTRNRLLYINENIVGIKKIVATIYTCLWIVKKIVTGQFDYEVVAEGVHDYIKGIKGKK